MNEATLILPNMRGGCATVGNTVHTLFRLNGRRPGLHALAQQNAPAEPDADATPPAVATAESTCHHSGQSDAMVSDGHGTE